MLFPDIPGNRSWRADGVAPCSVPPDGLVGETHLDAPDAPWPANGQNQEGARKLREAAVKRPPARAADAWAHLGSPGKAMGVKEPRGLWCVSASTPTLGGSQPRFRAHSGFWVTTLRTSSASMIASSLSPVHLAAVAMSCRENVEAANVLAQLLRHHSITVDGLPQWPVGSRSCGMLRRTLFWPCAPKESAPIAAASKEVFLRGTLERNPLGQQPDIAGAAPPPK